MRVENMTSSRGNTVANQFNVWIPNGRAFQSYSSVIATIEFIDGKRVTTLDRDKWNYSKTTAKYRNQFLGETTKETEAKIKSGEYKLADLN